MRAALMSFNHDHGHVSVDVLEIDCGRDECHLFFQTKQMEILSMPQETKYEQRNYLVSAKKYMAYKFKQEINVQQQHSIKIAVDKRIREDQINLKQ